MYLNNKPLVYTLNEILTSKAKITMKRKLFFKFNVNFRSLNKKELEKIFNKTK